MDQSHQGVATQMRELLTQKEVELEYGIAAGTLRYWRHTNQGPASFTRGKRVVYRRAELERWLSEEEKRTTRGGVA
jgi:predicted site-specific integrase-resolvase